MRIDSSVRRWRAAVVTMLLTTGVLAAAPADATAQTFISPFIGFDFGGDSGCPTASGCEDRNSNIGVAVGKLGAVAGGEVELGYAREFFGDAPGVDSSVLTLMFNVIVGPKIGPVRPFVLGGLGIIKSRVEFDLGSILDTGNEFGYNLGGGVMVMFGDHIGVRGDIRRFKSLSTTDFLGFSLADVKLGFNRASAGLVIGF
jgi:hypothetical protein